MDPAMVAMVSLIVEDLSDQELNALFVAVTLGTDPKNTVGYAKVDELFTENNGTKMHDETREVFEACWRQRFKDRLA